MASIRVRRLGEPRGCRPRSRHGRDRPASALDPRPLAPLRRNVTAPRVEPRPRPDRGRPPPGRGRSRRDRSRLLAGQTLLTRPAPMRGQLAEVAFAARQQVAVADRATRRGPAAAKQQQTAGADAGAAYPSGGSRPRRLRDQTRAVVDSSPTSTPRSSRPRPRRRRQCSRAAKRTLTPLRRGRTPAGVSATARRVSQSRNTGVRFSLRARRLPRSLGGERRQLGVLFVIHVRGQARRVEARPEETFVLSMPMDSIRRPFGDVVATSSSTSGATVRDTNPIRSAWAGRHRAPSA